MITIKEIRDFLMYGDIPTSYFIKRGMHIGKNFQRQTSVRLDPSHCWLIKIGDDVGLANKVQILAHDDTTRIYTGYGRIGEVVIGNRVFVGANTTITMNVHIGNDVIIAANSLVNRDIPDDSVVAGVPAKVIGHTSDFIDYEKDRIESSKKFDRTYTYYHKVGKEKKQEMQKFFEEHPGEIAYLELGKFITGRLCI